MGVYEYWGSPEAVARHRNRWKRKHREELAEVRERKAEVLATLAEIREEKIQDAEKVVLKKIEDGELRVRDLIYGVDICELADDFGKHGNLRKSARKYGAAALVTVAHILQSGDERNRLVAAKLMIDTALPDKMERMLDAEETGYAAIERVIVDIAQGKA